MVPKRLTLIEQLHIAMDHRDAIQPTRCTCETGETREGRPIYCGWNGTDPVCKRQAKGQAET